MKHRLALDPPTTELTLIDRALLDEATHYARASLRLRVIVPFHRSESELLHRMLNAVQPGSYVRPHRHLEPPKAEAWIILRGALVFFTFADHGEVQRCIHLTAGGTTFGVDLQPGIYHSFIALEPDTVIYEVKNGPYEKANDKTFAPWAPEEGSSEVGAYMETLRQAYLASL